MLDFLKIATKRQRNGRVEVYPKFIIKKSEDLMIRGGDFYAVWVENKGLWSTDEQDVIDLVDHELNQFIEITRRPSKTILRFVTICGTLIPELSTVGTNIVNVNPEITSINLTND